MDIEHPEEGKYNLEVSREELGLLITGLKEYLKLMKEGNPEYFEGKIEICEDMINTVQQLFPE